MKAIIFGVNGQDGYYLSRTCEQYKVQVIGVSRSDGNWVKGDIANKYFVRALIQQEMPDYIFNIAATSTTRHSALYENHNAIASGTIHVLEAVKDYCSSCRVFITGSGVQFVNNLEPISEFDAFEASSPYTIARIYSVYAARYYRRLGLKTYVGYLFHHESPMRKGNHLSKIICDGIKQIAAGLQQNIPIGDTSVKKEWAFAGDIAEGIFTLVNQDKVFEATVSTGVAYSVEDWLRECFDFYGLDWRQHVVAPEKEFKAEYSLLVSNNATILSLGWKPKVDFKGMVELMMNAS